MKPQARRDGILTRELAGELVVYDTTRHEAHCLNRTAAEVFRHADGRREVLDIARLVAPDAGRAEGVAAVRAALDRLGEAGLLEALPPPLSRREAVRRVGLGAAILAPAVASVLAPTPAEAAASCVTTCASQPDGTRCDVCGAGLNCATVTSSCVGEVCSDGCPNP